MERRSASLGRRARPPARWPTLPPRTTRPARVSRGESGPRSARSCELVARTHEVARWRETGEVAYERDFAGRLTLDDERIVRIVVMPGSALPSQVNSGSPAD